MTLQMEFQNMIQMNLLAKQENKLIVTKGGRVGGDKLGVKDQQIQTTMYKTDK